MFQAQTATAPWREEQLRQEVTLSFNCCPGWQRAQCQNTPDSEQAGQGAGWMWKEKSKVARGRARPAPGGDAACLGPLASLTMLPMSRRDPVPQLGRGQHNLTNSESLLTYPVITAECSPALETPKNQTPSQNKMFYLKALACPCPTLTQLGTQLLSQP